MNQIHIPPSRVSCKSVCVCVCVVKLAFILLTYHFSFPGALLPVPQRGGEEGATYVQRPEEKGSTREGHSETDAPQSSEQHL